MTDQCPCRTTIHCINWGFCRRCAPHLTQAATRVVKVLRMLPAGQRSMAYGRIMAALGASVPECPGFETEPNVCRCPCEGCRHNCEAHKDKESHG